MLIQRIKSSLQTGKTDLIVSIAIGAVKNSRKVLVVLPTEDDVAWFRKNRCNVQGVGVMSFTTLMPKLRNLTVHNYQYILIDGCDQMHSVEGDVISLIEQRFAHQPNNYPMTLIGTYTTDVPEPPILPNQPGTHVLDDKVQGGFIKWLFGLIGK